MKQATDKDSYQDDLGIEPYLLDSLPEKLSTNDLPKFKVTDNPQFHLKAFKLYMEIKKVDIRCNTLEIPYLKPTENLSKNTNFK